jgi:Domain of unknown function (DUF4410)
MNRILRCCLPASLALVLLSLVGCGSVSGLSKESANAPMRIAEFNKVEVLDFTVSNPRKFEDPKEQAEYDAALVEAQVLFADKVADAVRETGAFTEVTRTAGSAKALRLSGVITRYDEGNIVARGLTGFAGQTHLEADVSAADAGSGKVLATMKVDRNSWPLPVGASLSTLQTTGFFMNEAAKKIAAELVAKRNGTAVGK